MVSVSEAAMRPYWLSHHRAEEADRCTVVAGRHVCRRCAWISAGMVPTLVLLATGFDVQAGDIGLVAAIVVVAAVDFVQTARGTTAYDPRRVIALSPGVGAAMAWLAHRGATEGLGVVHVVAAVAAGSLLAVLLRLRSAVAPAS